MKSTNVEELLRALVASGQGVMALDHEGADESSLLLLKHENAQDLFDVMMNEDHTETMRLMAGKCFLRLGLLQPVHVQQLCARLQDERRDQSAMKVRQVMAGLISDELLLGNRTAAQGVSSSHELVIHTAKTLCTSDNVTLLISGFNILKQAEMFMDDSRRLPWITAVLSRGLTHANPDVRLAAFTMVCQQGNGVDSMLAVDALGSILQQHQDDDEQDEQQQQQQQVAFNAEQLDCALDYLAGSFEESQIFAGHAEEVVMMLCNFSVDRERDARMRCTALNCIQGVLNADSSSFRRSNHLPEMVFRTCVHILAEAKEEPYDGEYETPDGHSFVLLDDLCHRLPEIYVLIRTEVARMVQEAQTWQDKVILLNVVVAATEWCYEFIMGDLDFFVGVVSPLLGDAHPKVRFTAATAIANLSLYTCPTLQVSYGDTLLVPLLEQVNQRDDVEQLKGRMLEAVESWCTPDEIPYQSLEPYFEPILTTLTAVVDDRKVSSKTKGRAFTTIASLARASGSHFAPHYDDIVSAAKRMLAQYDGVHVEDVYIGALACISDAAQACTYEMFADDAPFVIQMMKAIHGNSSLTPEQLTMLLPVWEGISGCLGPRFTEHIPYLMTVLSPLVKLPEMDFNGANDLDEMVDRLRIQIQTADLTLRGAAVDLISHLALDHGKAFVQCCAPLIELLCSLFIFPVPQLQNEAALCITMLFKHSEGDPDILRALWTPLCQETMANVLVGLSTSADPDTTAAQVLCLKRCIKHVPQELLSDNYMKLICSQLSTTLQGLYFSRRQQIEMDEFASFDEGDEFTVLGALCNLHGHVVRKCTAEVYGTQIPSILGNMVMEPTCHADQVLGISMMGDLLEWNPTLFKFHAGNVMQVVLHVMSDEDVDAESIYCACHAIGAFIEALPDPSVPAHKDLILQLVQMLTSELVIGSASGTAALGKFLLSEKRHLLTEEAELGVKRIFMTSLVLHGDRFEGRSAHNSLLLLLERGQLSDFSPSFILNRLGHLLDNRKLIKDENRRVERLILSFGSEVVLDVCVQFNKDEQVSLAKKIWSPFQRQSFVALLCCHSRSDSIVAQLPIGLIYSVISPFVVPPGAKPRIKNSLSSQQYRSGL